MSVEGIGLFAGLLTIVVASSCAGRKFETASDTPDGGGATTSKGGSGAPNPPASAGRSGSLNAGGATGEAGSGGAGNAGSQTTDGGGSSAGGVVVSTGGTFGTSGAPSTGGAMPVDTGGASTSTGGAVGAGGMPSTGSVPSTGGLPSNTGGAPPSTGGASAGGAPSCKNSADCSYCCNQNVPASSTSSAMVAFTIALYGCACSTCYAVCDSSLCNAQAPDPSLACLNCVHANAGDGECKSEWDKCQTDPVCGAFGVCAFGCL